MKDYIPIIQLLIKSATIIIILYIFRKPLSDLIPNIRTIKYKDFEAEFSQKLEDLKKDAKNLPCSFNVTVSDLVNVEETTFEEILESKEIDRYVKLAKIEPKSAVTEVWRELEFAVREKVRMPSGKLSIIKAIKILEKKGLIGDREKHLVHELRMLRNQAVHVPKFELTFIDAIKYVELTNRLICYIKDRKL